MKCGDPGRRKCETFQMKGMSSPKMNSVCLEGEGKTMAETSGVRQET
jgi:hypothetical protein